MVNVTADWCDALDVSQAPCSTKGCGNVAFVERHEPGNPRCLDCRLLADGYTRAEIATWRRAAHSIAQPSLDMRVELNRSRGR